MVFTPKYMGYIYPIDSTCINHSCSIPLSGIMSFSGDVSWEQCTEESIHPSQKKAVLLPLLCQGLTRWGRKQADPVPAPSIPGPSPGEVKEKLGGSGEKRFLLRRRTERVQEMLPCGLLAKHQDLLPSMGVQLVTSPKRDTEDCEKMTIIWMRLN